MRLPTGVAAPCLALALLVLSACGGSPDGGGDVSAKESEASYVASVERAVTLAAHAVSAARVDVVGRWESCMGGYRYRGTGAIDGSTEGDDTQVERVRTSLTGAGFTDVTQVPGHVSVQRGDLGVDIARPGTARPRLWSVSFFSDCRVLTGSDKDYAEQSQDYTFPDLHG